MNIVNLEYFVSALFAMVGLIYELYNQCLCSNLKTNLSNESIPVTKFVHVLITSVFLSKIDVRKWCSIITQTEFRENLIQLTIFVICNE